MYEIEVILMKVEEITDNVENKEVEVVWEVGNKERGKVENKDVGNMIKNFVMYDKKNFYSICVGVFKR